MMNALLSSCFLFSKKSEITFANAKQVTDDIYKYIKAKKIKTHVSGPPQNMAIQDGAINLGLTIQGKPLDKRQGDKAVVNVPQVINKIDRLSLSYYAMPISDALCQEAIVACALFYLTRGITKDETTTAISIDQLVDVARMI